MEELDLTPIGFELDLVSLSALEDRYPALAGSLSDAVSRGATPEHIRRYALQRGMPRTWATWLEQAARALSNEEE